MKQQANILTLFNGLFGSISIILVVSGHQILAATSILVSVILDYFDGKVARKLHLISDLGKQLDSLSDLVSFGVAPAILLFSFHQTTFAAIAAGIFIASSTIRLGRFNLQTNTDFVGMPTTANGIFVPIIVLLSFSPTIFPYYLIAASILMNAPVRIKKI